MCKKYNRNKYFNTSVDSPLVFLLFLSFYIAVASSFLKSYLIVDSEFSLSILLSIFGMRINADGKGGYEFSIMSMLAFSLYFVTQLSTFYYFGFCLSILHLVNMKFGSINVEFMMIALFSSPMSTYFFQVFGFPIRLWITKIVCFVLNSSGVDIISSGNVLMLGNSQFEVEPVCTGLKMLVVSITLSMIISNHYHQHYNKHTSLLKTITIVVVTIIFVILANIIRIATSVTFRINETNFMHEVIGLIILFIYVFIPMAIIIKHIVKRWKHSLSKKQIENRVLPKKIQHLLSLFLGGLLVWGNAYLNHIQIDSISTSSDFGMSGYCSAQLKHGTTKLEKDGALIYIKKPKNAWAADHNPSICWRGSGFELTSEQIISINGFDYLSSKMIKGDNVLFTSWWFTDGHLSTISQLSWRFTMIKEGKIFYLINATANSEFELKQLILELNECLILNPTPS